MFVTSRPTISPIVRPTTSIPTTTPSITGLVATFEVTSIVTESLDASDVDEIENGVLTAFNASEDDVTTTGKRKIFMMRYVFVSNI